jgi:signal transduction histidine kinase
VQVVRGPSWWTPRRLLQAMAGLAVVLLTAFVWVVLLRLQVITQSAELAKEMRTRRDAAVEFDATLRERNRLAANLHDTLLQTLGGIGYQLEACEVSGRLDAAETKKHFDMAQRMVDHAMSQLHDSVWTLRSLPLRSRTFPEALRALAERMGQEYAAQITVETNGSLEELPEFVAGNLLLVLQEAVSNALRHGDAAHVAITVAAEAPDSRIDLSVRDDGQGFVPGTQQGVEQGHFGIEGMRERVERLGEADHARAVHPADAAEEPEPALDVGELVVLDHVARFSGLFKVLFDERFRLEHERVVDRCRHEEHGPLNAA